MADEAVRSQSRQSQNPRCCRLLRLGKKEWKQQFGELQILFKRIVLWRRQVPWKKIQRCQSRSKHDENSLCCRHFSGPSLSERNVLPGTVTNAWRVRNSKVLTCGWKTVTVRKLHGFSWRLTFYSCQRLGCCRLWRCLVHRLDKFSKLMNSQDGEVEVSFMTKGKGKAAASSFKWTARKDVFKWFERKSILCASYWGSRSCR